MKKNIKSIACVIVIMTAIFSLAACTNNNGIEDIAEYQSDKQETGIHVYNMHLEGDLRAYDGQTTRSTSYAWPDKSRVYLAFFTTSSIEGYAHNYKAVNGTATYNASKGTWTVVTTTALPSDRNLDVCHAYYFANMEKEQAAYKFTFDETTPIYSGQGKYMYNQGNDIIVSVILAPSLWRLRFRGEAGTKVLLQSENISLTGSDQMTNEFVVYGSDNLPGYDLNKNNSSPLNYSLTIEADGYTPYVYGSFHSGYDYSKGIKGNILKVTTDADYQRTIDGSDLMPGESGVIVAPSLANYASEGWTLISSPNTELWPDYAESALGKTYDEIVTLYGSPLAYEDNVMGYYMHNDYINVVTFRLKEGKAWIVQLSIQDGVSETTINNYLRSKYQSYKNGTDNEGDRYFSYINAETIERASIGISYYPDSKVIVYQSIGSNGTEKAYLNCPDTNHPHLIDLGLPSGTKWACCNVDASKPEEYGGYYACGETQTKEVYNWSTYQYGNDKEHLVNIGNDISGTQYDVATLKWGSTWHIPTGKQCLELCNNTTKKWISINGVNGMKFTGSNGGAIFIPAGGRVDDSVLDSEGKFAHCWTSSMDYDWVPSFCSGLILNSDGSAYTGSQWRCTGENIRPVQGNPTQ